MYTLLFRSRFLLLYACCLLLGLFTPLSALAEPAGTLYVINGLTSGEDTRQPGDDVKKIEPFSDSLYQYTDFANGFSLRYPSGMIADASLSAVRTLFTDGQTDILVFYDSLADKQSSAAELIEYGNRFRYNTADHRIETDKTLYINGRQVHLLKWTRRQLSRVAGDKNHYVSAEIVKNPYEVYTLLIKSAKPIENELELIQSVSLFPPQGHPGIYKRQSASTTPLNEETRAFLHTYFDPDSSFHWGVFEPSAPYNMTNLLRLEESFGYRFPFVIRYQSLDENMPLQGLQNAYQHQTYVELTLQTLLQEAGVNALKLGASGQTNAGIVYDMLDGQYDDYLAEYARRLKEFNHPVLFRLNNEMNGDWCWYSAYYTGKDADLYIALWRYIQTVFANHGVDNVIWVWNPHDLSRPDFKWNHYLMYYPGDEYVDLIGLTGYNTGTYFPGERWREFKDIYTPLYSEYASLFNKPFLITEFGSNSVGGDKAAWIRGMFDQMADFPRIKAAIWWSGIDYDQLGQPGRIYLINETEEIIQVFRERLKEYEPKRQPPDQNPDHKESG